MVRQKKFAALLLFFLWFVSLSASQVKNKKWTLQECIETALQNNIDIRIGILNTQLSKLDYTQSQYALLPSLNASAGHNYNFGRTIDRFTNQFTNQTIRSNNFNISAGITLYNGRTMVNTINQRSLLYDASLSDLQVARNQISLNVASAFLQIIFAKENIKNTQLQFESTQNQLERTVKLVEAGSLDIGAELNLKAQLANDELNHINAQNQYNIALVNLKNLMMLPESESFFEIEVPEVQEANFLNKQTSVDGLFLVGQQNMPEIASAALKYRSSVLQLRVANGSRAPNISLFANLNTVFSQNAREYFNPVVTGLRPIGIVQGTNEIVEEPIYGFDSRVIAFGKQLNNNFGQSVGLSFQWNLFNGYQIHNNIQRAKLGIEQSHLNYERAKNSLLSDITSAIADYEAARKKYYAALKSYEAQNINYEFAQKRFDAGVMNPFDFITIQNNRNIAMSNLLQAKYDVVFRALVLDYYSGIAIRL